MPPGDRPSSRLRSRAPAFVPSELPHALRTDATQRVRTRVCIGATAAGRFPGQKRVDVAVLFVQVGRSDGLCVGLAVTTADATADTMVLVPRSDVSAV